VAVAIGETFSGILAPLERIYFDYEFSGSILYPYPLYSVKLENSSTSDLQLNVESVSDSISCAIGIRQVTVFTSPGQEPKISMQNTNPTESVSFKVSFERRKFLIIS
jgi:hypothetical protein